ncbi:MAG: transposase [Rhodobacteraceae bacterium]|nr:transposase [Paracoccaceae bacterium]
MFYCYATGNFSSRGIEQATYELIPVIFITGNTHPDHNSINTFRKRFLAEMEGMFLQILLVAHLLGVLKVGTISIDGTKVKANAGKHKALSWGHANKIEAQLQAEVEKLLALAGSAEGRAVNDLDIPEELERRQERLARIAQAKAELERRAQERYERERAEYEAKLAERQAKEAARGRKLGGKKPKEPEPGPRDKDQINLTDEESRIMPVSGGGFEQSYNAQASVDMESLLVIGHHVSQQPNDKQEIVPALDELEQLPEALGKVDKAAADTGYFSQANVEQFEQAGITPYIASGRQAHYGALDERLEEAMEIPPAVETSAMPEIPPAVEPPPAMEPPQTPETPNGAERVTAMRHRMKTEAGKALYAKRKSTVEPVFGIIKHVMGFRQFMLRGLEAVSGEWNLVCIAFNLKRMYALTQ